ncbi:Oxoglutarate/iron-dependent oxygenase [Macrophomina phaseolina MS6]|uniref:Oxoglutarate/iron-dependent oxygenase n=2 Tax=Macrophomina phaseolina TaxID=35725 RepID=K2RL10_MACPH|nr:Oxoglutarate/iron-dependent oxygenase [Macrophomina phaseolina MS6]
MNPPGPSPQRGWSKLGAEKTSTLYGKLMGYAMPDDLTDAREHFDFGPSGDPLFPNRWPSPCTSPSFRSSLEALYTRCEAVSHDILTALAEALELSPTTFVQHLSPNASEFRINHYPAISDAELASSKVERIWPHFDLGVVTLLFADGSGVGGLQFEDRVKGGFADVEAGEIGEVLVNVSETLQRWTGGELPAGLHRVTKPAGTEGQVPERFTMAYFCKAARHAKVGVLPPFKKRADSVVGMEAEEEDITALEYQQTRLLTAY